MQSIGVGSTAVVGNHTLSDEELAAGVAQRSAFLDEEGAPVDPDEVLIRLTAPTGETRTFSYPEAGPTDSGVLTQEETGRFYVAWTPAAGEDGLWTWELHGALLLGTGRSDQDVFFVKRPIAPGVSAA